jgi:Beta propeller domain
MCLRNIMLWAALAATAGGAWAAADTAPRQTLKPFADEAEFSALVGHWQREARKRQQESRRRVTAEASDATAMAGNQAAVPTAPAAATAPAATAFAKSEARAGNTAGGAAAESITNVQTAGVDEGGIVKRAGDHLVILRRGRLFTVRVGGDALRPVAAVDAYAPGASPAGAWYDEMLIDGSTVVVIGYSDARGGTEIGLFELGRDGSLAYRATHHLRSNDYYSSRNYASRLIGNKLIFYTPLAVNAWSPNPQQFLPHWRRWRPDATPQDFKRILPATRIYRTDDELDPFSGGVAMHTVTTCDLGAADMHCESTAVMGPPGRVFYVSAGSVYVWTTEWRAHRAWGRPHPADMPASAVFRIPLDASSAPSALKTTGSPIDQLSFLEDDGGHLNVLLRAEARGDGMWNAERNRGDMALLRVALRDFGDGTRAAPSSAYKPLPGLPGWQLHNRFVGEWLVYGTAERRPPAPPVHPMPMPQDDGAMPLPSVPPFPSVSQAHAYAVRYAGRDDAQPLALRHGVQRIEALGSDAVVVGNAGRDLHFTSVRLSRGGSAEVRDTYVQRDAAQGETRTHGFFYKPTGRDDGVVGLPIVGDGRRVRPGMGASPGETASVLYLRNQSLSLAAIGQLDARERGADDHCKASCIDWYGNARPLFLGERVFALLGYELVEGQLRRGFTGERIDELRRVSFAPARGSRWGRGADE